MNFTCIQNNLFFRQIKITYFKLIIYVYYLFQIGPTEEKTDEMTFNKKKTLMDCNSRIDLKQVAYIYD